MRRLALVALGCTLLAAPMAAALDDAGPNALAPHATATLARDRVVQLSLGAEFALARRADGALVGWGRNNSGVFRDTTYEHAIASPLVVGRALTSVHAGYAHVCGVTADQQLICWGNNRDGQAGAPFDPSLYSGPPMVVRLPSGSLSSVSLGSAHSCALVEGRGVYCWGLNDRGQCDGTPSDDRAPTLVRNTSDVVQIAAGAQFTCARTGRGTVSCWGDNEAGQLGRAVRERDSAALAISGLTDVRSLSAGYSHACAITGAEGALRCWGLDAWGAITDGDHTAPRAHFEPTLVPRVRAVREVALGYGFTCALSDADRTRARVYCWGHAESGKTGVEWHHRRDPTPHEIALSGEPESISASMDHACALLRDGAIECWGDGSHGELGDGRPLRSTQLVAIGALSGVTHLVASGGSTCASTRDAMRCWGLATHGQFAIDAAWGAAAPTLFRSRTHGGVIALGANNACECPRSGACSCAGDGLLTDATGYVLTSVLAPHDAFARGLRRIRVRSIAAAASVQCMSLEDGRVICVGEDRDHLISGASSGARVVARAIDTGLRGPQSLVASRRRVCAWDARGTVRCAGDNEGSAISDDALSTVPWTTAFTGARAARGARRAGPLVATDRQHTCAIVSGLVRCRGASPRGARDVSELRDAEAIFAGDESFCARRTNGQYFCWGINHAFDAPFAGGMGSTPSEAPSLRGAVELALGLDHLCARWRDGSVSCVGANDHSQLGDGTTAWSARPVRVRLNGSTAAP
ncbi:MAG: hypothetical protein U0269_00490 [Polyangiales bacterium]